MQNRPKYNAKKTIIGNLKFDSRKEAEYYLKLKAKRINGEINWIKLQPEFLILRGFILEFKVADSEENLIEKAEEAIKQIEDKKYYISLQNRGIKEVIFVGMAFYKKLVKIKSKSYK